MSLQAWTLRILFLLVCFVSVILRTVPASFNGKTWGKPIDRDVSRLFSYELGRLIAQSGHLAVRWTLDCYILFRPEIFLDLAYFPQF